MSETPHVQKTQNTKIELNVQPIASANIEQQPQLQDAGIISRDNYKDFISFRISTLSDQITSKDDVNQKINIFKKKLNFSDEYQHIKSKIESCFDEIDQLVEQFSKEDALEFIQQIRFKINDYIQLYCLSEIKNIDYEQLQYELLKKSIDEAIKIYDVKSVQKFQEQIVSKIQKNKKRKILYEKKKDEQNATKVNDDIVNMEKCLASFKRLQILDEKLQKKVQEIPKQPNQIMKITPKKYLNIKLLDKNQFKKFEYDLFDKPSKYLLMLGLSPQNVQMIIYNQEKGKYVSLESDKPFNNYLELHIDYEGIIKRLFEIKFAGDTKKYPEGTQLNKIQKEMGKKYMKYCFYNSQNGQYIQQQIKENLLMQQIETTSIVFNNKKAKNSIVPVNILNKDLIKFLNISSIIPKDLSNLFIAEASIDNKWIDLIDLQDKSLSDISEGKQIECIKISYNIELVIHFESQKSQRQIIFQVRADEPIQSLKSKFSSKCQLEAKLQQWNVNQQEINNHETFLQKQLFSNKMRVEVLQLKNIEYYGFSKYQPIQTEIYLNFNIEDDQIFKQTIAMGSFPHENYEWTFRVLCLGIIFSAIKKHCRIETALSHIKKLVRLVNLSNQTDNNAKNKLWQSNSRSTSTYFNQFYVLHNILLSAKEDLKIELMRTYKNHSPLFLFTADQKGKQCDFSDTHFWINTKSFVITSIQIGEVKGKSTLLNHLFNTGIQTEQKRHPICSKSVMINYNVYRNQDCLVDLVDVSTNSISQKTLKELCFHSNMIIIHYNTKENDSCRKWVQQNYKDKPIIYFERDNCTLMDNPKQFKRTMEKNNSNLFQRAFILPNISQQNILDYYDNQFQQIVDSCHLFIERICKQQIKNGWMFSKFLAKTNQDMINAISIFQEIQDNFNTVINMNYSNITKIQDIMTPMMTKIIDFITPDNSLNFMSKLRESIRIIRSKRLKQFLPITVLQKLLQVKDADKIKEQYKNIQQLIQELHKIDIQKKTQQFCQTLKQMRQVKDCNQQNINILREKAQKLNNIFHQKIKNKQFSIQNFWRCLVKYFDSKVQIPKQFQIYIHKIKTLFAIEFKSGKTFQLINGDSLQIPLKLLTSIQTEIEHQSIMIVGIFGPQSSGKSTLLNYLFGCDFASSDGRCTSGIYGTYYEIQNGCLPCKGILVLDTEGLFSTYLRSSEKGKNFDNKLVLFLLKVCDIIIMNTRGDVDKNCQNILEVSFDSVLMEHKQGAIYPNFYIVLNQSAGKMNLQQEEEVRMLRNKIIAVNTQMEKYMSTNQSNSMPIAFNISDTNKINSECLRRLQLNNKKPTDEFYRQTKQLSLKIIDILKQRSRIKDPKVLIDAYENMNAVWSSILNLPMLTMHASKLLKYFDDQIQKESYQTITDFQAKIQDWNDQMPKNYLDFDDWLLKRTEQFQFMLEQQIKMLKKKFPIGSDVEKNSIINKCIQKIRLIIMSFYDSFKAKTQQRKLLIQFNQNKKRGVQNIMRVARDLRKMAYNGTFELNDAIKDQQFNKGWENHVKALLQNMHPSKTSHEKYLQVRQYYVNQLKHISTDKIKLPAKSVFQININETFKNYASAQAEKRRNKQKSSQFYYYFTELNIQPIISIKAGANSLPKQYLKMQKFFKFQPSITSYYLSENRVQSFWNYQKMRGQVIQMFSNIDMFKSFTSNLLEDIKYFRMSINYQDIFRQDLASIYFVLYMNQKCHKDISLNQITFYRDNILQCPKHQKQYTKRLFQTYTKNSHKFLTLDENSIIDSVRQEKSFYNFTWSETKVMMRVFREAIYYFFKVNYVKIATIFQKQILGQLKGNIITNMALIGIKISQQSYFYRSSQKLWFKTILIQQKAIQFSNSLDYKQRVKNLPHILNKKIIQNSIDTKKNSENKYCIGFYTTQKICVIQQYKREPVLQDYIQKDFENILKGVKNVKFKRFIFPFILRQLIFTKILKCVEQAHEKKSLEDIVDSALNVIKKEISEFNQDLKQISHELTYEFIVQIHDYCCNLISKKLSQVQCQKYQIMTQKLKVEKIKQNELFMNLLNKDTSKRCKINASIFLDAYEQFSQSQIQNIKGVYLQAAKKNFKDKYARKEFQRIIDQQMQECKDPLVAEMYLLNPQQYLRHEYAKLIQRQIKEKLNNFISNQLIENANQLLSSFNELNLSLKGSQGVWESDTLFQNLTQQDSANILLRQIFVRILKEGISISSNFKNNKYRLKKGITFQHLSIKGLYNKKFLTQFFLQQSFQIDNYAIFVNYLCQQLQVRINRIKHFSKFSPEQLDEFRVDVQLKFCLFGCPFCGRLCDIDIKDNLNHGIHECSSGHQMRAIKGIKLEVRQNGKIKKYASIMRCQKIDDFSLFEYDGIQKRWIDHKKDVSNWSFSSVKERTQQLMFQRLWSLSGKSICEKISRQTQQQFIYLDYNEYDQKIKDKAVMNENNHYIFSIDGSGSMSFNNKWNDQITQLTNILAQLGKSLANKVSINIFTDDPNVIVKRQYADKVYPKSFHFPGGASRYEAVAAFKGAISVMEETGSDINTHFIYLSDGHGVYPEEGINQILSLKSKLQIKGYKFSYTSILIGGNLKSSGMDLINEKMKGQSKWVQSATQIGRSFRQVFNKKS